MFLILWTTIILHTKATKVRSLQINIDKQLNTIIFNQAAIIITMFVAGIRCINYETVGVCCALMGLLDAISGVLAAGLLGTEKNRIASAMNFGGNRLRSWNTCALWVMPDLIPNTTQATISILQYNHGSVYKQSMEQQYTPFCSMTTAGVLPLFISCRNDTISCKLISLLKTALFSSFRNTLDTKVG